MKELLNEVEHLGKRLYKLIEDNEDKIIDFFKDNEKEIKKIECITDDKYDYYYNEFTKLGKTFPIETYDLYKELIELLKKETNINHVNCGFHFDKEIKCYILLNIYCYKKRFLLEYNISYNDLISFPINYKIQE